MTQAQYNEAINLIGHVILSSAEALTQLLYSYGIAFKTPPTRSQLIDATVDLLHSGDVRFNAALSTLVEQHIDTQGDSMLALRKAGFNSYMEEDEFFGGLIKGAIGALGGLFKKKKRTSKDSSRSSSNANDNRLQEQALQALQAKRDLERQIQRMKEQQRREREERQRQEAAAKARRSQMLMLAGGGVLVLGIVAVVLLKPKQPQLSSAPYYPIKT